MINNDEQVEENETSFYIFILKKEGKKKLKKNTVKSKYNFGFVIDATSDFPNVTGYFLASWRSFSSFNKLKLF